MFSEIERGESLVEIILQRVTDAIVSGEIGPDEKLIEARLAQDLGVSRGPIREAVCRLEQMGLVEKVPYMGTFVRGVSRKDIEDLYEVRAELEGLAARKLATAKDSQHVVELQAILQEMEKAMKAERPSQLFLQDAAFHDALIYMTENKLLGEIWNLVGTQLRRIILLKRDRPYRSLEEIIAIHAPIVEAIASGDPQCAEAEARQHVETSYENFWSTYQADDNRP